MLCVVLRALVSTLLRRVGAQFCGPRVEGRLARTETPALRREVGDVAAEARAILHLLATGALIGAPLGRLHGFEATVNASFHLVGQVVYL
jgi:hypothetical protein